MNNDECRICAINYDFMGDYETFDQNLADFKGAAELSPKVAKRLNVYASNKSIPPSLDLVITRRFP